MNDAHFYERGVRAVAAQEALSSKCSLCWFVLNLYPKFEGMTARDTEMFTVHLEMEHGWKREVPR
jgi:hypothetical protein